MHVQPCRRTLARAALLVVAMTAAGCVVEPVPPPRRVVVEPAVRVVPVAPPPGVVYVEPRGPVPAPGYLWRYHPQRGWGWYHEEHGWRH